MARTYLNDSFTDIWPFASGQTLPFPNGAINSLGACIIVKSGQDTLEYIAASSVNISKSLVSVTLVAKLTVAGTIMLGVMSCSPKNYSDEMSSYADLDYENSNLKAHCWMSAGSVLGDSVDSGLFRLDSSCVIPMPSDCYSRIPDLTVNSTAYSVGEVLGISFTGSLDCSLEAGVLSVTSSMDPDTGYVSEGEGVDYPKVTSINGVEFDTAQDYSEELRIKFEADSDSAVGDVFKCSLINAVLWRPGDAATITKNDYHGEVTTLVITGTHKFPNCYTDIEDEA